MNDLLLFIADVSPYRNVDGGHTVAGVHQSLGSAARAFEEISQLLGLECVAVTRVGDVTEELLARARVLVLFTIGETPWDAQQRRIIEQRVESGELGLVAMHSATDSAYDWPAYRDLVGARFDGHPVTGYLSIRVVDPDHPATAHLPSPWRWKEELYVFRDLVPEARILLGVDFGTHLAEGGVVTLPFAWCIEKGPRRTFYTVPGHFIAAYEDVTYLRHLRGGVEWVLETSTAQ
jgi:type 1 glutamine amidotransferase